MPLIVREAVGEINEELASRWKERRPAVCATQDSTDQSVKVPCARALGEADLRPTCWVLVMVVCAMQPRASVLNAKTASTVACKRPVSSTSALVWTAAGMDPVMQLLANVIVLVIGLAKNAMSRCALVLRERCTIQLVIMRAVEGVPAIPRLENALAKCHSLVTVVNCWDA